jgi:ribosomal protein S18 acetylase RimI-like enzyme
MSEPVTIRAMLVEHLAACGMLVETSQFFQGYGFSGPAARRDLEVALRCKDSDLRVALMGDVVYGFAWFVRRGAFDRSGYLRLIAVKDDSQGMGIGRYLMDALEATYIATTDIILLVTSDNLAARAFYERLGYEECGRLADYVRVGSTECIYAKASSGTST